MLFWFVKLPRSGFPTGELEVASLAFGSPLFDLRFLAWASSDAGFSDVAFFDLAFFDFAFFDLAFFDLLFFDVRFFFCLASACHCVGGMSGACART